MILPGGIVKLPLRTGVDVTSVDRIQSVLNRFEDKFKERFFEEVVEELDPDASLPPQTYAGLWAAKEAVFKAIGRGFRWQGVRIGYEASGRPYVTVDYDRARLDSTPIPGDAEWDISITHDRGIAIAFAACTW